MLNFRPRIHFSPQFWGPPGSVSKSSVRNTVTLQLGVQAFQHNSATGPQGRGVSAGSTLEVSGNAVLALGVGDVEEEIRKADSVELGSRNLRRDWELKEDNPGSRVEIIEYQC